VADDFCAVFAVPEALVGGIRGEGHEERMLTAEPGDPPLSNLQCPKSSKAKLVLVTTRNRQH
jgi:hypothetical protein